MDAEEAFELLKPRIKKDLDADNSIDIKEAEEILDVVNVIASILLVDNLRIQKK